MLELFGTSYFPIISATVRIEPTTPGLEGLCSIQLSYAAMDRIASWPVALATFQLSYATIRKKEVYPTPLQQDAE